MFNVKASNTHDSISVGSGEDLPVKLIGDLEMKYKQPNGIESTVLLRNLKYVPDMMVNLFSLTKSMKEGAKLTSNENYIG